MSRDRLYAFINIMHFFIQVLLQQDYKHPFWAHNAKPERATNLGPVWAKQGLPNRVPNLGCFWANLVCPKGPQIWYPIGS